MVAKAHPAQLVCALAFIGLSITLQSAAYALPNAPHSLSMAPQAGSFMTAAECSVWLNDWIMNYCVNPSGASDKIKAERPLADAKVEVREVAGKPGWYEAVAYLKPHYQLETLTTSLRLVAEVPKKS